MHEPRIRHLVLVPRRNGPAPAPAAGEIRRFSLARVAVSPRSALGTDRHERMERIAERDRRRAD